jgi:hypothetical protein
VLYSMHIMVYIVYTWPHAALSTTATTLLLVVCTLICGVIEECHTQTANATNVMNIKRKTDCNRER